MSSYKRQPKRSRSNKYRSRSGFKSQGSFAKRVKAVVLNRVAEKKHITQTYTNQEFDWDGHRHYLTEIAAGTGESGRVGRHVTPSYVSGRVFLELSSGATTSIREAWSILLVRDKQQVGDNYPTAGEIIALVGTQNAPMGLLNAANKGRFELLRRWSGTLTYHKPAEYLDIYHKLKPMTTSYNGDNAVDIERNGLILLFISSADPIANMCYFSGHVRMWYTDV